MFRPVAAGLWPVAIVLLASVAAAQTPAPGPPGPYVIDVRGTTLRLPQGASFYPAAASTSQIPARGFGIDAGAHVYPMRLGPARIGFGVSWATIRASLTAVAVASTSESSTPTAAAAVL